MLPGSPEPTPAAASPGREQGEAGAAARPVVVDTELLARLEADLGAVESAIAELDRLEADGVAAADAVRAAVPPGRFEP